MKTLSLVFVLFFLLVSCDGRLSEKGLEMAEATQRTLGLSLHKK